MKFKMGDTVKTIGGVSGVIYATFEGKPNPIKGPPIPHRYNIKLESGEKKTVLESKLN